MSRSAKRRISFSTILLVTFAVAGVSTVWAQPKAQFKPSDKPLGMPVSITEDISLDQLKAQKASVERSADLDAMDKKNMLNLLDKAIQSLDLADKINRQRDELAQTISGAADRLLKLKVGIDQQIVPSGVALHRKRRVIHPYLGVRPSELDDSPNLDVLRAPQGLRIGNCDGGTILFPLRCDLELGPHRGRLRTCRTARP